MGYANTYQLCILANRLLQNVLACEILTFQKTSVAFCAGAEGREWVNLNERRSNILILFVYSFIYLFSTYSP